MQPTTTPSPSALGVVGVPGRPPEPWERVACRRLRRSAWFWGLVALSALLALASSPALWPIDHAPTPGEWGWASSAWLVRVVLAVTAVAATWRLLLAYVAHRRIVPRVLATGGRLCPRCCGDLHDSGGALDCPWCDASYAPQAVTRWWQAWAVMGESARAGLPPEPGRRIPPTRCGAHGFVHRQLPLTRYIGLLALYAVFVAVLPGGDPLVTAVQFTPALGPAILAMASFDIWSRTRRRRGSAWHCAGCGYQRSPEGPHSPRCPECGSLWGPPGTLVRGRPVLRRAAAATLIACLWIPALLLLPRTGQVVRLIIRLVPSSVLVSDASLSGSGHPLVWAELQRRSLSDPQIRRLAVPLIQQIERHQRLPVGPAGWLGEQFRKQRLPADLLRRMLTPMFSIRIETCDTPRVGRPCLLSIQIHTDTFGVRTAGPGPLVLRHVRQVRVDDEVLYQARPGLPSSFVQAGIGPAQSIRTQHWTPRESGPATLSAEIWIFVVPGSQGIHVLTGADGLPKLDQPPLYRRKLTITRRVLIADRNHPDNP